MAEKGRKIMSKYYPDGFTNQPQALGSLYSFTNYLPILNFTPMIFFV